MYYLVNKKISHASQLHNGCGWQFVRLRVSSVAKQIMLAKTHEMMSFVFSAPQ